MKHDLQTFDPLARAASIEKVVCQNSLRKYSDISLTGPFGGVSTAFVVGCCLRCIYCWVDGSLDEPEKFGRFYSPEQTFEELIKHANKKGVKRLRISGGEPSLCRTHLVDLLGLGEGMDSIFTLETNGILFGADEGYVRQLAKFKTTHIRISLKAGTPEGFRRITGAHGDFFELPFVAVEYFIKHKLSFHVSVMSDPRLMSSDERSAVIKKLGEIGYKGFLEEETCEPFPHSILRLKAAGVSIFTEEEALAYKFYNPRI